MNFSKKLDFLMNVTKTSNSVLAKRVSLDASYVSRMRNGKRSKPKNQKIVESMAVVLAYRCSEEYQLKILSDALQLKELPSDHVIMAKKIAHWFVQKEADSFKLVECLQGHLSTSDNPLMSAQSEDLNRLSNSQDNMLIYTGVEGKRQAIEQLLHIVLANKKPQMLLIFTEEEHSWLIDDPSYTQKWSELMIRILANGNKIKVIHTMSRDFDVMQSAIRVWVPVYLSGNIEPYFYSKNRDGIFRRTLFIVPSVAAVISTSIGSQISVATNFLFQNSKVITSFEAEFNQYLDLCRPLMNTMTIDNQTDFYEHLYELSKRRADMLYKAESLSIRTLPESLFHSVLMRLNIDIAGKLPIFNKLQKTFLGKLRFNSYTEIVHLPDLESLNNGQIIISLSEMIIGSCAYYTPEEYAIHLENIIKILDSYENYYVHITNKTVETKYSVIVKEDHEVIIIKNEHPMVVYVISESTMTATFWDFCKNFIGEENYLNSDKKEKTKALLRSYLHDLYNMIGDGPFLTD